MGNDRGVDQIHGLKFNKTIFLRDCPACNKVCLSHNLE